MIVDVILSGEITEYQLLAGDLYVDGALDVLDIVMLVDLILGS